MRGIDKSIVINFDTLSCETTSDSSLLAIEEKLKAIRNPWTGNKRKMVFDIFSSFDKWGIEFDSIIDLFSGSCMVSVAAKMIGKKVVSNDLLTFSYLNALSFLSNNSLKISEKEINNLISKVPSTNDNFVLKNYVPNRFLEKEADVLDRFYWNAVEEYGNPVSDTCSKSTLAIVSVLHYVMQNCYLGGRLNKGQVVASLAHRLSHPRCNDKDNGMGFKNLPKSTIFSNSFQGAKCYNMDAVKLLRDIKPFAGICYIDPPYGSQQSDYAAMYSFFEEYIWRKPMAELPHISDAAHKFVKPSDYYDNFLEIVRAASYLPVLVLSYNDSSWAHVDKIRGILEDNGRKVEVKEIDYRYRYRDTGTSKEYLILAVNK